MIYANLDGLRVTASPRAAALCPMCGGDVLAKCGRINVWHWAHRALVDCDDWAEPVTTWHFDWQNLFPEGWREVTVGRHRADIRTPDGWVIELQHGSISVDEVHEREAHYGDRMVWLFDAREAFQEGRLSLRQARGDYRTFRWKHARKVVAHCRRPVVLDLDGENLLLLGKLHLGEPPHAGWGHLRTVAALLASFNPSRAAVVNRR